MAKFHLEALLTLQYFTYLESICFLFQIMFFKSVDSTICLNFILQNSHILNTGICYIVFIFGNFVNLENWRVKVRNVNMMVKILEYY